MNDFDTELNVYLEGMQALNAYDVNPEYLSVFYNGYSFEYN